MNCIKDKPKCLKQILDCHGIEIFWSAIAVIAILLLIVIVLVISICCICYRKRKSSAGIESKEVREGTKSGEKGDAIRMTEIGGEVTGEGESKAKANDRAEDTKLENFAEAMYATVDCTQDQPSTINQTKQTLSNADQTTDGDNYDIITHIEEDVSARAGNKSSSVGTKSTGKAAKKSKEKKAAPETAVTEVEYSVPDKAHKQKKQNARKISTNLEQGASGGELSTSLEYNTLLHVTSSGTQRLSMPPPASSEYSIIAQLDGRRNGSTSDVRSSSYQNGRQRGRISSPPEEPPPPLPPPFVDGENPAIDNANKRLQSSTSAAASKQQQFNGANINHRHDLGGLYGNTSITAAQEELALYDDPESLVATEPQQEMYMNVGKQ